MRYRCNSSLLEIRTARQLEKDLEHDVILDLSEWEDDVKLEGMFRRLIDGLELFYKG